jgi:hypothetical protein
MHKGPDRATVEFDMGPNEIQQYVSGRYIGAMEAAWRIFENRVHEHNPSVKALVVHLPGKHTVTYRDGDSAAQAAQAAQRIEQKETELMAFFRYNASHPGEKHLYADFPGLFTWSKMYVLFFSC